MLGSDLVAERTAAMAKLAEFLCDLHAIDVEAVSGRRLDRKRAKDIFCVTNLWGIAEFRGQERGSPETAMLALSERWLAEWAELESQGRW